MPLLHTSSPTSAICLALSVALALQGLAFGSGTFEKEFLSISRAAEAARKGGRLEDAEEKRVERLQLVRDAAADNTSDTPILAAYRALEAVDGSGTEPGLVNNLDYDEAAHVLIDAWKAMCAASPQGPVLGEVATRLFEVVHQKAAVWAGTADQDDAAKPPIDDQSLLEILTEAERLDPCCVTAIPMIEWLKPLDPKESFLRAEVRPSFKARQQRLLSVSHPLLKGLKSGPGQGPTPPGNNPQNQEPAAEGQADAVLPWHAPTEYLKAQSLQVLLDETETLEDVLQNWYALYGDNSPESLRGRVRYIIPRKAIKGRDANGNRFELLYGRLFLTSVLDKNNRRRPAAILMDTKGRWEQRMINLLWREPSDQEVSKKPELRALRDLVMRLEVLDKWSLGGIELRLCSYPVQETELLLRSDAKILCLKDAFSLPKIKFKHANNDPDAMDGLLDHRPGEFQTDPLVAAQLQDLSQNPDKTRNVLVELAKQTNIFVVLSRSVRSTKGPTFFVGDGLPFLRLQDGGQLFFKLEGDESPVCYRETKYGRLVYPLNGRGIPNAIVIGCGAGKCMTHVLGEAGFSTHEAQRAIQEWIATESVPDAFVKYVRAKAEARKNSGGQKARQGGSSNVTLADVYTAVADLVDSARASQLGLSRGNQHIGIRDELLQNFFLFGYRHFHDKRGNIFFSANLRDSFPVLWPNGGYHKPDGKTNREHVFAVVQSDGRPIAIQQLYAFDDYQQMSRNKRDEYLTESLLYAPSFGTYGAILEDALHPFIHPDDKNPLDVGKAKKPEDSPTGNAEASPGNWAFTELRSPIPTWLTLGDEKQAATLKNLHNAYVELVSRVAGKLHAVVNGKDQQPAAAPVDARFGNEWRWLRAINQDADAESLLAIQLASARRYARQRFYHRAVVYYNDLLERMPAVELSDPYTLLLEKVPTTEEGRDSVKKLESRINELSRLICLQMELAGVLRSAGKTESAHAIFGRIADDVEFFVKPTFGIMKHLLTSYGLQMEQGCDRAISRLEDVADLASRAISQFDLRSDWRTLDVAEQRDIEKKKDSTARLIELIDKSTSREKLSKEESKELESLRQQDEDDRPTEFRWWLERKKLILGDGSNGDRFELACRISPNMDYDVRNGCPLGFTPDNAFQGRRDALVNLVVQCKVDDVVKWCADPLVVANAAPVDLAHGYLLAWFWADRGDNPKARAALMNVATLYRGSADAAGDGTPEGLVHRSNMFRALACANCLSQSVPGVRGARVDFTDALGLQVLMWEREWLAGGLPPHQAVEQAEEIKDMISDARAALTETNRSSVVARYFFPDYSCRYGGVPDYVVREVIEHPDLFKEIKPGEVGSDVVPEAVKEEGEWIQVTKDDALGYFRRLPSRVRLGEVDREVVGVR